jgi:hypothetical protein
MSHSSSSSLFLISPGGFLAANMVNALLARILIAYDFKSKEGEGVSREHGITSFRQPGNANVLFRERQNMRHLVVFILSEDEDNKMVAGYSLGIYREKRPGTVPTIGLLL